jgi:putative ABC transport system permease protein
MSRRQARVMIRHEGIITALIGAAMGLPLGVGLAALITRALSSYDVAFQVPVVALIVFAGIAVLAGILAATVPGRRAARIDVLRALQYE